MKKTSVSIRCFGSLLVFALLWGASMSAFAQPAQLGGRGLPGKAPGEKVENVLNPANPEKNFKEFNQSSILIVGELVDFKLSSMVARSMPPIYTSTLTIKPLEVLRGNVEVDAQIKADMQSRQINAPKIPKGRYLFVLSNGRGGMKVEKVFNGEEKTLEVARKAAGSPIGWKPGEKTPPRLAGKGIKLEVKKVPPAKEIKWTNPDGDGEYTVTVTNTTDKPLEVPALFNDGDKILWRESVRLLCQGKCQYVPGAGDLPQDVKATTLKPGQSVSTVVNALALKGQKWPRGGYRIEFRFALGEYAVNKSFYYMSRHHDALREKAAKEAGGEVGQFPFLYSSRITE